MSDEVSNAINQSRTSLVMRDPSRPFVWNRLSLPDDAREFFERVEGGTLLPTVMADGIAFGFEIEPDALMMSINEYFGIPPGDSTLGHCDKCFAFAHHISDPESVWGIDLNPASFGRIFSCRMALGEHPQHQAFVVANSLSEWLRFWMDNLSKAAGDWRELDKEPQLAPLA
jgi:hypothetical protein